MMMMMMMMMMTMMMMMIIIIIIIIVAEFDRSIVSPEQVNSDVSRMVLRPFNVSGFQILIRNS